MDIHQHRRLHIVEDENADRAGKGIRALTRRPALADKANQAPKVIQDKALIPHLKARETKEEVEDVVIEEKKESSCEVPFDFVNDIHRYLISIQGRFLIEEGYLLEKKITSRMRSILVDWLVQVHDRFGMIAETLHLSIYILDKVLQKCDVQKDELQLIGVTALYIAAKYEEMYAPDLQDFESVTENMFTRKQIIRCEMVALKAVDFDLGKPHIISFLRYISTQIDADAELHCTAKYLMDMSLMDPMFCSIPTCLLAASLMWLSLKLHPEFSHNKRGQTFTERLGGIKVHSVAIRLAATVYKWRTQKKLLAIHEKFSGARNHHVSHLNSEQVKTIEKLSSMA